MIAISYDALLGRLEDYVNLHIPYKYTVSGTFVTLQGKGFPLYKASTLDFKNDKQRDLQLPFKDIYFINKVRQYILKNELHLKIKPNYKTKDDIKFFDFNKEIQAGEIFTDCYSIDIIKAYHNSAFKENWINTELYNEGFKIDKKVRNAAYGSWAKKIDTWNFDGKKETAEPTTEPEYPHIFFNQANTIYNIMDRCMDECFYKFLFYWTDGIYVTDAHAARICQNTIFYMGFESNTTKLKSITRTESKFIVQEKGKEDKNYNISLVQKPSKAQ